MTPRQRQRRNFVVLLFVAFAAAATLALYAFEENLLFFYTPTQAATTPTPQNRLFNLGGMVLEGSVAHDADSPTVTFALTDHQHTVSVRYTGILPDLFAEGQGLVATGKMDGGVFVAERVLAKHDEKYMPPGVAESLAIPMDRSMEP